MSHRFSQEQRNEINKSLRTRVMADRALRNRGDVERAGRAQILPQSRSLSSPTTNISPFSMASIKISGKKPITKSLIMAKLPSFSRPQPVVTVIVDKEEAKSTFIIHKDLAAFHSPFFAAAFKPSSPFLESSTQTMRLEDIPTSTFGLLVHWLYTQTIDLPFAPTTPLKDGHLLPLVHLWALAQRCLIPRLQNQIMDLLHPLIISAEEHTLKAFLECVYKQTKLRVGEEGAELKRLAADRMAWTTTGVVLEKWILRRQLPAGMLLDILRSLKRDHLGKVLEVGKKMRIDGGGLGEAREYYVKEPATGKGSLAGE